MSKIQSKFDLHNKTALITGSAGLLGAEHAAALLQIGSTVVLTDINKSSLELVEAELLKDYDKSRIITKVMNVVSLEMVRQVAAELSNEGLNVDILINNAAIDPKVTNEDCILESSRLENFSLKEWNAQLSVGLTGAFLCSQVFGASMAKNESGGVILNIASDLSVFSPDQRLYRKKNLTENMQPVKPVSYSVIKTGLIGLTRYLATYWADKNIRCNALSPGGVFSGQGDEFVQRLNSLIPLGRMATKDEYRGAVQFLCSDASSYMNGQNLIIDGGRSVW